jgi:hypothetical protein
LEFEADAAVDASADVKADTAVDVSLDGQANWLVCNAVDVKSVEVAVRTCALSDDVATNDVDATASHGSEEVTLEPVNVRSVEGARDNAFSATDVTVKCANDAVSFEEFTDDLAVKIVLFSRIESSVDNIVVTTAFDAVDDEPHV